MNILPLVFTFLIIFSCIALTFFREVKSYFLVESTLDGYRRTERVVGNAIAQKAYRKIKGDPLVKKEKEKSDASKEYVSRRTLFPPLENAKFNIGALVKEEGELKLHPLYEPLAALLRLLYQDRLYAKEQNGEDLEYRLVEAMLKKARKLSHVENLSELYPDDPKLKAIYYRMLKGTNQYSRESGIPPLSDFLCFDKEGKAASLCFASPLILEALFGSEIASGILAEEKKKWEESNKYYFFTKEDFQTLLTNNPSKGSLLPSIESYLDYSKGFKARDRFGGRDKITGIGVEKQL